MVTYADQFPDQPTPLRPLRPSEQRLDPRRGLPRLPIFWTLDQVAQMLNLTLETLSQSYVWFDGRDTGRYSRRFLRAVNLSTARIGNGKRGRNPSDWRIAEGELIRWLTVHNLWLYDPFAVEFDYDSGQVGRSALRTDEYDSRVLVEPPIQPTRDGDAHDR